VGFGVAKPATSYLPLKINPSGVIPIIFAASIVAFPGTLATFSNSPIVARIGHYFRLVPMYII